FGAWAGDQIGTSTGTTMIQHYGARDARSVYQHYSGAYGTYGGGVILAWKMGTGSYAVPEGVLQP
ncbi:MAG TPA: hypothetical protein VNK05_15210, partial [Chloroflexota bacterium]|nr:hypothetical protein [Chloroflexota bacterium]